MATDFLLLMIARWTWFENVVVDCWCLSFNQNIILRNPALHVEKLNFAQPLDVDSDCFLFFIVDDFLQAG